MLYQNSEVSYFFFPWCDGLHQLTNDKSWMTMMHSEIEDLHNEAEHATTKSNMMFVFEFVVVHVYFLLQWLKEMCLVSQKEFVSGPVIAFIDICLFVFFNHCF